MIDETILSVNILFIIKRYTCSLFGVQSNLIIRDNTGSGLMRLAAPQSMDPAQGAGPALVTAPGPGVSGAGR